MTAELTVWTIGHSTRPLDEFLGLLDEYGTQTLADVRSYPSSRYCPQFGQAALSESLVRHGLHYRWIHALGGRRKVRADSVNTAWRNASFRGYADYMQTDGFAAGLDELLGLAQDTRTTIMCAEAVWWRCHRSMIADTLKARGVRVMHIMGPDSVIEHPWTAPARIVDGKLTYGSNE
ncbi:MAG: DUF488 domain-containing protein [Lysobacteraceae bacterium]